LDDLNIGDLSRITGFENQIQVQRMPSNGGSGSDGLTGHYNMISPVPGNTPPNNEPANKEFRMIE
jgi:hypothetical protein